MFGYRPQRWRCGISAAVPLGKRNRYGFDMTKPTAAQRAEIGVQSLATLMNYWLATSSHDRLVRILNWGFGESCGLDGGALSRIRNGKQTRGAGLKHLDAMAEANRAIWLWHTAGPDAAIREFGPHSSFGVEAEWINDVRWFPKPDDETQPLDLGDFARLLVGRLNLDYLGAQLLSPSKLQRMNQRLTELLDDLAADLQWGPREAIQQFSEAYPSKDPVRLRKFREVVSGMAEFTPTELELELAALAEMVRSIRKAPSYTPADLQEELLSVRRRP